MTAQRIKEFQVAISQQAWDNNFQTFCDKLGFVSHTGAYSDSYAEDKWQKFQSLVNGLNAFDSETLAKLLAK